MSSQEQLQSELRKARINHNIFRGVAGLFIGGLIVGNIVSIASGHANMDLALYDSTALVTVVGLKMIQYEYSRKSTEAEQAISGIPQTET